MPEIRRIVKKVVPSWIISTYRILRPRRPGSDLIWVLKHLAVQPTTIFDVGANIGDTVRAFKDFTPSAKIYAFEPISSTFQQLQKNTAKYRDRVHIYQIGFSFETRKAMINVTTFHGANSLETTAEDYRNIHPNIKAVTQEEIPLVKMDEFVKDNSIEHIDLLKIDVEGHERDVLVGGSETLASRVDIVCMEMSLSRHGFESDEWIDLAKLMHDHGFGLYAIYGCGYPYWPDYGLRMEQFDAVFAKHNGKWLK